MPVFSRAIIYPYNGIILNIFYWANLERELVSLFGTVVKDGLEKRPFGAGDGRGCGNCSGLGGGACGGGGGGAGGDGGERGSWVTWGRWGLGRIPWRLD